MMPNRILRDTALDSDRIAAVGEAAEVLFYRLIMLADDFGRFDGRLAVIRARAFALRQQVSEADVSKRIDQLAKAGLVFRYEAGGKPYIALPRFDQRQRAEKSKFPDPPADWLSMVGQLTDKGQASAAVVVVVGGDVFEGDKPIVGLSPDAAQVESRKELKKQAVEVIGFLNEKAGRHYQPVKQNVDLIVSLLGQGVTVSDLRAVVAKKCREWKDKPDMDTYLRPATLFGPKNFFQKYQGEIPPARPE